MGLKRFYHVIQDQRGMILSITVYSRVTDTEALNGNEAMKENFFDKNWRDTRERSHSLLCEDQLKIMQHKITKALKVK